MKCRIIRIKRSIKAISPIISVLLMIAIAVVAALVAYAWLSGYMGFTTTKVSKAIQLQSIYTDGNGFLVVYVQNVGQGSVTLDPSAGIYVGGTLYQGTIDGSAAKTTVAQGQTVAIVTDYRPGPNDSLTLKVTTTDGTWTQTVGTTTSSSTPLNSYSIVATVNPSGAGTVTPDKVAPYHYNDVVTLTESPNNGYTFSGWSGDGTGSGTTRQVTVTGNMAVTAGYTQNTYTLTLTLNPPAGGSVTADKPAPYHYGDVVTLTETPANGYAFSGWTGDGSGSGSTCAVTMDGNKAVTAAFTQSQYTITATITPPAAGSVTFDKGPPYHYGDVVTLTESPNNGYTFSGWGGDGSGSGTTRVVTVTGDMAVSAGYTQNSYSVVVTVNPSSAAGTVTRDKPAPYHYGDVVTLTESSNNGYTFSGWSGDGTGTATTCQVTVTRDMAVSAGYTQDQYTLTLNVVGTGCSVTKSPSQATYTYGTVVQLTPVAASGWAFQGWSGDLAGNANPGTISMTSSKTVTATFTSTTYQVTFVSAGAGSASTGPSGNPTPGYPSNLQANDLILLQVAVRGDPTTTVTPPANFALLYGPDQTGGTNNRVTQWIYYKFTTGTETPTATVTVTQSSGAYGRAAVMYAFRNVALTSFYESGNVKTANSATISHQPVTTSGVKRLAVSFESLAGDPTGALGLNSFTGASGGTWTIAVDNGFVYHGTSGDHHIAIGLQTATMTSQGTISGGTDSIAAYYWTVRSFALIPR